MNCFLKIHTSIQQRQKFNTKLCASEVTSRDISAARLYYGRFKNIYLKSLDCYINLRIFSESS